MRSEGRVPVAAVAVGMLLCAGVPGLAASIIDQVVGAIAPDGGAQLVKHFSVPEGSVITGFEFVSNDLRTVFPKVALLQGAAKSTAEAKVLAEAVNVQAVLTHRVRVTFSPVTVSGGQDLYVAVTLPASNGVTAVYDGAGLGATNLPAPNGSYIASAGDGVLQPISLDLGIDLIQQGAAKTASTGEAPDGAKIPKETFLSGGSPNPATSVAQVQFGLDRRMPVKLAIYNVAGRLVRLLAEGPMDAGVRSVAWDGKDQRGQDVAAGVYIAKLQAGDKVLTQKMVIAK